MHLVCFTGGATEFSSMRSSRLVGRKIDNQTINFSVNVSTKVALVLTRGHEVSRVNHTLRNSVLPFYYYFCLVFCNCQATLDCLSCWTYSKRKKKQTRNNGAGIILSKYIYKCQALLGKVYLEYPLYFRWFTVSREGWKKMAKLLEEGYRMPKPQHVDEKLYEKIVLLLLLFFTFLQR